MSIGGGQTSSSQSSTQDIWDQQSPYLQNLYGSAQDLYNNPNAATAQGNQMMSDYAGSQGLQNTISGAQSANQFMLDPSQAGNNPYLDQAMASAIRPVTQNYQENVLGGITDGAVQAGQMGSSRQGIAEGIAARGYMDQVGDITNQMAYQDYSAGMDRMAQGVDQSQGVANLGMMPSQMYQDVGQQGWNDLANYQGIIGAPTTLGTSSGGSSGWNFNAGI